MERQGRSVSFVQPPPGWAATLAVALLLPLLAWSSGAGGFLLMGAIVLSLFTLTLLARMTLVVHATPAGLSLFSLGRSPHRARLAGFLPQIAWSEVTGVRSRVSVVLDVGPVSWAWGRFVLETGDTELRFSLRPRVVLGLAPYLDDRGGGGPGARGEGREVDRGPYAAARRRNVERDLFYRAALRTVRPEVMFGEEDGRGPDRRPSDLLALGYDSILRLRLRRAEACLTEALTLLPENASLRSDYALLLCLRGRLVEAEAQLAWMTRRDPRDPDAWIRLGDVSARRQREEEAARFWRRAVECGDPSGEAWTALGLFHLGHGRRAEARRVLHRAVGRIAMPGDRESLRLFLARLDGERDGARSAPDEENRIRSYFAWGRGLGVASIYLFLILYVLGGSSLAVWAGMGGGLTLFLATTLLARLYPEG